MADPVFGVEVPTTCPKVPAEVLTPRDTWSDGKAYDERAKRLAGMFVEIFKQFAADVSEELREVAPNVA